MADNIHPIFSRMVQRNERERRLRQRSKALWFTGLSGSGKSTIAIGLERMLFDQGYFAQIIDGDNLRHGLNANLGFSLEDRTENIRRVAELTKLYVHSGIITLCTFVSPTREIRQQARQIIGESDFKEVYINTPLDICEQRDVKGLYAKARRGEIKDFTGIDAPYEAPEHPDFDIRTNELTIEQSVQLLFDQLLPIIRTNNF
jgi:adenylylsulfate kinase